MSFFCQRRTFLEVNCDTQFLICKNAGRELEEMVLLFEASLAQNIYQAWVLSFFMNFKLSQGGYVDGQKECVSFGQFCFVINVLSEIQTLLDYVCSLLLIGEVRVCVCEAASCFLFYILLRSSPLLIQFRLLLFLPLIS